MRGGTRALRRQNGMGSIIYVAVCNVTALIPRWQTAFSMTGDIVALVETRTDRQAMGWLRNAARARGWTTEWSTPVPPAERRIGGGMAGKSGGVCLMTSDSWRHIGSLDDLQLAAPATHVAKGSYMASNGAGVLDIVAYYGHPTERQRTVEDLRAMEAYAWSSRTPLLVMGDFNLGEDEFNGATEGLADVGAWWAQAHMQEPEPTYLPTNGGRPTRVDRIWLTSPLLRSVLHFSVTDELDAPGHRTLRTMLEMRPALTLDSTAGSKLPSRAPSHQLRAQDIAHIQNGWNRLLQSTDDIDVLYEWWALNWEMYIANDPKHVPCRNRVASVRQTEHNTWQPRMPLHMRRLANYIEHLRHARSMASIGREAKNAWRHIRAAGFKMAAMYGAPTIDLHGVGVENCVDASLDQLIDYFSKVHNDMLRFDRAQRKQQYREGLHERGGINGRVRALLRGSAGDITLRTRQGQLVWDDLSILQEAYTMWSDYFGKPSRAAKDDWQTRYITVPQQPEHDPGPLTTQQVQSAIAAASNGKVPGPDTWRYEELKMLPTEAIAQLCVIFNRAEDCGRLPYLICQSWTALIGGEGVVPTATKLRPISTLSCVYKIYMASRLMSIRTWLDGVFPPCICSYLTQRDARANMMQVLKRVEQSQIREDGDDVVIVSLDASKAFPSVSRLQLASILRHLGMKQSILSVVLSAYEQGWTRLRLRGRTVHRQRHQLLRGIHQGCPMSVIMFLAIQLPAVWLMEQRGLDVQLVIFADDVTVVANTMAEAQRAVTLLEEYYATVDIQLNASKTQVFSARGHRLSLGIGGGQVEATKEIKVLGIPIRSMEAPSGTEATAPATTIMMSHANQLRSLPMTATTKQNAFQVFTMNKIWWCPWQCTYAGQALTRARCLTLRAVRPTMEVGPRVASVVTVALTRGAGHDPICAPFFRLLQWLQLDPDPGPMLRDMSICKPSPRGPYSTFAYLCHYLGLTIVWDHIVLDDYDTLPVRHWEGRKKTWQHRWRGMLRQACSRGWSYRREFRQLGSHYVDDDTTLWWHHRIEDPQHQRALEIALSGGMLTGTREYKHLEPEEQSCECGQLDTDYHRYWTCGLTGHLREQLTYTHFLDWPYVTLVTGWKLQGHEAPYWALLQLQRHLTRVVLFFARRRATQRRNNDDGHEDDDDNDHDCGGGGGGPGAGRVVRGDADDACCGPADRRRPWGTIDMMARVESGRVEGTENSGTFTALGVRGASAYTKRRDARSMVLPPHIVQYRRLDAFSDPLTRRLTCTICDAVGKDVNRRRFINTHLACPTKPRKQRLVNTCTVGERRKLHEAFGDAWAIAPKRVRILMRES